MFFIPNDNHFFALTSPTPVISNKLFNEINSSLLILEIVLLEILILLSFNSAKSPLF